MIFKFSLLFLMISLMIDPTGDFYNFKYISALLAFFVFWIYFIKEKHTFSLNSGQVLIFVVFCILMPIYGIVVTFIYSDFGKINDSSYLGFSMLLLLLLPVTFAEPKMFFKTFIFALRSLSVMTVLILISFVYDTDSLGIAQFFIDKKSMLVGFREYAGIQTYFLYFTAAPLLIILVAFDSYRLINRITVDNILLFILSALSIFLTGTRFNMLMAIIILPAMIIIYKFSVKKIVLFASLALGFFVILFQSSFISSFFSLSDGSNSVKLGYFDSYADIFKNPEVLLLGQGFNAYDSSILFKNMLMKFSNEGVKTELTLIEMFRVFGIFFGSFFNLIIILVPYFLYKKFKEINFVIVGIVFYLVSSLMNPYIFSTNGVLVFLFILVMLQSNTHNYLTTKDLFYD